MNDPDTIPPLKVTYQGRRYLLKGKPGDGPGVFTYELSGFSPLGNDDDDKSEHDEGLAPGDCNPPNFIRRIKSRIGELLSNLRGILSMISDRGVKSWRHR